MNQLISINQLENAAILISYLAMMWYIHTRSFPDPHPVVCIKSDNNTSKARSHQGCKDSLGGRALSHTHSALLLSNPVGLHVACISTADNVIADHISHISLSTDIPTALPSLLQDHKAVCGC